MIIPQINIAMLIDCDNLSAKYVDIASVNSNSKLIKVQLRKNNRNINGH